MIGMEDIIKAALIGIGGTVVLDLWALLMARVLKMPATNWPMVGRWIGNMPRGQFVHESMAKARPVTGEAVIGWSAHYVIGIGYGLLLLAFWGAELDRAPDGLAADNPLLGAPCCTLFHHDARHGSGHCRRENAEACCDPPEECGRPLDLRAWHVCNRSRAGGGVAVLRFVR
ncbi:DUF2938 domain-containing protein [Pedomonas mirosovicensis]|uniref:DUF2938 domain-containing protein n=1 Tax=Pedomonas mirosovicensis TaxID=2908641 RepID=UPI00216A080D|nr:DUF2938 domain-containing protein [Pedomonas mirosovicensis]MCH8686415.1 DUF2938 domain-containing protein [Pedomonas mirosovicensis]